MAIRVFRVAVVGCPRLVITSDPTFSGVGKSCLCNRFVRPEAYTEAHDSTVSPENWTEKPAYNGDHFLYWGATSKYLGDGTKVRFQVIEQTEFCELVGTGLQRLRAHRSDQGYLQRAASLRVVSQSPGKAAYQTHPEGAYASSASSSARTMRSTQLFPNEDFGGAKGQGVSAYVCVFDPTLVGDEMTRQRDFLTELIQLTSKTKKRIVLVCVKCDAVDEGKRKLGSGLANTVLKKPIPYIETSAREGINVEEAFFMAATGSVKKKKSSVTAKHVSSSALTYKEGAESKKQDANQARDAYRRLLMRKVTHFACLWNDILPILEVEPEYNHLLKIGGEEAKETVKKMFCMRLIELKIKEANEQLKLNTIRKKLDNGQQKAFQTYLSDAFKQHPDMGPDFLTECNIPSGRSTPNSILQTQIMENGGANPGTPLQNGRLPGTFYFSPGRSSLNPSPRPNTPLDSQSGSYGQLQLPLAGSGISPSSSAPSPAVPIGSPVVPTGSQLGPHGPQGQAGSPMPSNSSVSSMQNRLSQPVLMLGSPQLPKKTSNVTVIALSPAKQASQASPISDQQLPPVPSRNFTPFDIQSNTNVALCDAALPHLVPLNDTVKVSSRPFSSSMDCLLGPLPPKPEPDAPTQTLGDTCTSDAQPYLNPRDLGLGPLPPSPAPSPPPRPRGANQFRSLRVAKPQSRPQLPEKMKSTSAFSRTQSLKGHKRSHSNPGILEASNSHAAKTLPLHFNGTTSPLAFGNGSNHTSITAAPSSGNDSIPIEASAEFAHSDFGVPVAATGDGACNADTSGMDIDGDDGNLSSSNEEDDNQSVLSGPFEEIDDCRPSQEAGGPLPSQSTAAKTPSHYAVIEDYVTMRSAQPAVGGVSEPAVQQPQNNGGGDDSDTRRSTFSPFGIVKRQFTKTKRTSMGDVSPPTVQGNQTSPQHEGTAGHVPSLLEHNLSSSSLRPLPPSPDKHTPHAAAARKVSNANIYEVIDESWAGKQNKSGAGWTSSVDPSHYQLYEQVVKEFFRDPVVTQQWWNAVRKVVPAGNMAAFPPPFFQAPPPTQGKDEGQVNSGTPLQTVLESTADRATSGSPEPQDEPTASEQGRLGMTIESIARSRDDMIGFINQQLNQSMPSDSEDDQSDDREDCQGGPSSSEEEEIESSSYLEMQSASNSSTIPISSTASVNIGSNAVLAAVPTGPLAQTQVISSSMTPPLSSSASPSPSLTPPKEVRELSKRPTDCPQVSEKQKKALLGVAWCTDLDLMSSCGDVSAPVMGDTSVPTFSSHALEADDSESEC